MIREMRGNSSFSNSFNLYRIGKTTMATKKKAKAKKPAKKKVAKKKGKKK